MKILILNIDRQQNNIYIGMQGTHATYLNLNL